MKRVHYILQILQHNSGAQCVKIISIALGLLMSIFLFSRVAYELSFDSFWHESENLYYIKTGWAENGILKHDESINILHAIPAAIAREFPDEVKSATTCYRADNYYYFGNNCINLGNLIGDSLFFTTMGWDVLEGNLQELANPNTVFLSQSSARKIFGDEVPLGKTLIYEWDHQKISLLVKGIFADIPLNTAIPYHPEAIISFPSLTVNTNKRLGWNSSNDYLGYLRLRNASDAKILNERLTTALSRYLPEDGKKIIAHIAPIRSLHLSEPAVRKMIWIMITLGIVLLFTTALNYVLISIASLSQRAKTIGVHKCSGASEYNIFSMFMIETAIIILLALSFLFLLVYNCQELLEELAGVPFSALFTSSTLWAPLSVVILLFLIGGTLPGIVFSHIPVTQVFLRYSSGRRGWKRVLLFVQFGSAAFILSMLLVVYTQYSYLTKRDRGYRSERVVIARQRLEKPDNLYSILRGLPYVENVALADNTLLGFTSPLAVKDNQGNILFYPRGTAFDKDFVPFMGLRLIAGHNLTGDGQLLVNRKFVELMKWPSTGVGEYVNGIGTVVGILDDISFAHVPQDDDSPVMITWAEHGYCVHARLKEPFDYHLRLLNEEMIHIYPQKNIIFFSMEDNIRNYARSVRTFCYITLIASITIIFIIFMGLFGYITDEIRLRSKEIAIRKISGADVNSILKLLSRDTLWVSLPAIAIGTFGSWKAGQLWLSQFVDTVHLSAIWYVIVALCLTILIVACVIIKAWRIANQNPVQSIRSE